MSDILRTKLDEVLGALDGVGDAIVAADEETARKILELQGRVDSLEVKIQALNTVTPEPVVEPVVVTPTVEPTLPTPPPPNPISDVPYIKVCIRENAGAARDELAFCGVPFPEGAVTDTNQLAV